MKIEEIEKLLDRKRGGKTVRCIIHEREKRLKIAKKELVQILWLDFLTNIEKIQKSQWKCKSCDKAIKNWEMHVISQEHLKQVADEQDPIKAIKRRFFDEVVEECICTNTPLCRTPRLFSPDMQIIIQKAKFPIKFTERSIYRHERVYLRKKMSTIGDDLHKKQFSLILDKCSSSGQSVLVALARTHQKTRALFFVDICAIRKSIELVRVHKIEERELEREKKDIAEEEDEESIEQTSEKTEEEEELRWHSSLYQPNSEGQIPDLKDSEKLLPRVKEEIISQLVRLGIVKTQITALVSDRERFMVKLCQKLVEMEWGEVWIPCLSHVLNSLVDTYMSYFFTDVPKALRNLSFLFRRNKFENRALLETKKLPPVHFSETRWLDTMSEYMKLCHHWKSYLAAVRQVKRQDNVTRYLIRFLTNESYIKAIEVMRDKFIPCVMKALTLSQNETPSKETYDAVLRMKSMLRIRWRSAEIKSEKYHRAMEELNKIMDYYYGYLLFKPTIWTVSKPFSLDIAVDCCKLVKKYQILDLKGKLSQYLKFIKSGKVQKIDWSLQITDLSQLALWFQTLPMTGAEIERFFSILKQRNTMLRTKQSISTLMHSSFIKYNMNKSTTQIKQEK